MTARRSRDAVLVVAAAAAFALWLGWLVSTAPPGCDELHGRWEVRRLRDLSGIYRTQPWCILPNGHVVRR